MRLHAWWWLPFLLVPFLWPGIFMAAVAEDLLALATALMAAAYMWQGEGRAFSEPWPWSFLLLILAPVLLHLLLGDLRSPWLAWRDTMYIASAWLVFMMARAHAAAMLRSPAFAWVLTAVAYAFIAYALIQAYDIRFLASDAAHRLFPVWSGTRPRFPGPMQQPNFQGLFLTLVVSAQLFQTQVNPNKAKLWTALAVLPLAGILLTASRAALPVLALALLAMLYLAPSRRPFLYRCAIVAVLGTVLSFIIANTVPPVAAGHGQGMLARIEAGSIKSRLLIWETCIRIALHHPFLGIGWGNLPAHSMDGRIEAIRLHPDLGAYASALSGGDVWAHDLTLQGWVEGGIPGMLAMLLLYAAVLKKGVGYLGSRPEMPDGRLLGLLFATMLLVHGIVSVSVMQPYFMAILALSLAAAFPLPRDAKEALA